jgi:antitoxin (DNA-binding transcriptional repressor) of toxin-antitoxin stability system
MSDTMSDMKDINTRELQKHTRQVRERVAAGESLRWVMGEETVAYITPALEKKKPEPWPDLEARMQRIYGEREPRMDNAGSDIVSEGRGEY